MSTIATITSASTVPTSATAYDRPVASDKMDSLPESLQRLSTLQGFEGKVGQTLVIPSKDGKSVEVLLGVGKKADVKLEQIRSAAAAFVKAVPLHKKVATSLLSMAGRLETDQVARAIVEGVKLGTYTYTKHKGSAVSSSKKGETKKEGKKKNSVEKVVIVSKKSVSKAALVEANAIADAVKISRDFGNDPGGDLLPEVFAKKAKKIAADVGLTCTIWDQKRIVKEKLGGLLAVNQGSENPAKLVKLEYKPAGKATAHVVLVGKGITFDSGGLSLKNAAGMKHMKIDMAGGAAVLAALSALPAVKAKIAVTGFIPLTDNMTGGAAIRPGDVFTARNGKTVEVLNTDAEGRMVLADGLSLAAEMKPDAIIDIATLTGAASVALGTTYAALMATDEMIVKQLEQASKATDENIWRLPLPASYRPQLDSFVADMKNIGSGPYGGTILAGLFLKEFVDEIPWAHLDLGLSAFSESPAGYIPKGATGFGVRLLVETLVKWN